MNVYPVNALEACSLNSPQKESYALLRDLHNRYLDYQVDFNRHEIELSGQWDRAIPVDCFIIANTNAISGTIKYLAGNDVLFEKDLIINEFINIYSIVNEYGIIQKKSIDHFLLTLKGNENISIGLIYIGETWVLPRFLIKPKKYLQLRNENGRTFSGQAMGIPVETLIAFSVQFARIDNLNKKLCDNYINGVQTVIPHIIDPYPKAHDEFEPFFATVSDYGEQEKREEDGFYWNFNIAWQEAK